MLQVFERVKADLVLAQWIRAADCSTAVSKPSSESLKAGTKTGTPCSYADLRIPRWPLHASPDSCANGVIQLVGAHDLIVVPLFEDLRT